MNRYENPLILNVDDYEAGRYAITRILEQADFQVREAATGVEALSLVDSERPDLVLLDVNLPDISGYEVCRRLKSDPVTACIPVLHISASSMKGADRARGLEAGADNYLIEPVEPEVLIATVRATLRARWAEDAVSAMARQLQTTFDAIGHGIALLDSDGRVLRWNRALERLLGLSSTDVGGRLYHDLWQDAAQEESRRIFEAARLNRRREETDVQYRNADFHVSVDPVLDSSGAITAAVHTVTDITDRKRLEAQFHEAQKFESIGQLAAGVAHDFNNLLTSILGNASLILSDVPDDSPHRDKLEEVVRASERAAELTRQLLAYSGKGRFVLKPQEVSALASGLEELMRASIPKKVRLLLELGGGLPRVDADPAQIQQVLLSMVINAGEAIGEARGTIRVVTGLEWVPEGGVPDLRPGPYVYFEIRDSGPGIPETVIPHIFDPFFSTKFTGRGLGLSAAAGIVRSHRGAIQVQSTPGQGATFRILLPVSEPVHPRTAEAKTAGEIVLVVDDEDMVRRVARATLEARGYRILLAENGRVAVDLVREHGDRIGLVLLDMTMPVMGGEEAIGEILSLVPQIKVIASSGYSREEAARRFGHQPLDGFLLKPYTSRQLAEAVGKVFRRPTPEA